MVDTAAEGGMCCSILRGYAPPVRNYCTVPGLQVGRYAATDHGSTATTDVPYANLLPDGPSISAGGFKRIGSCTTCTESGAVTEEGAVHPLIAPGRKRWHMEFDYYRRFASQALRWARAYLLENIL